MNDLFDHLRQAALPNWNSYIDHPYIRFLVRNQLPDGAFQRYLVQDYLFLIQFARAQALAVFKSKKLSDMRKSHASLSAILDVELDLHVRVCAGWGLSAADLENADEHDATVAYTRFVLDAGMGGDLLDLQTALAPCVIGYAEIANRIVADVRAVPGHAQADWVEEYAGEAYQDVAAAARRALNDLAEGGLSPARLRQLEKTFAKACDLEASFWQMALDVDVDDDRASKP